ncbi:hypothetical protein EI71_00390 [Anaeroplasma bactoclasticum]|jgi:hypothetical protein|uniref:Uncharacterized protein n=1 Tax=Anaeroplasma bactoclasticum TaxID=2088 RepID=A0A397RXL1_9MOLU|nr:hypothetical protein [Anaeroplasma bactoclasticum]RIA78438.1 hypothetical protein EI71_00390 [Anaeroplasma bactoclasticum]
MKKKLIGLFGIAALGIALASCGYQDQKLSTSKDFDITIPEVDSNAKLLTGEEKTQFIEKNSSHIYESSDEAKVEEYMNGYSSMVIVAKTNYLGDDYTLSGYFKSIVDYKNKNYWYYEKFIRTQNDVTYTDEVETKIVYKDDNFLVKTSINLNNHEYVSGWESSDDGYEYALVSRITGKADIYTTVSSNYDLYIFIELPSWNRSFYSLSQGYASLVNRGQDSSIDIYSLNNYTYSKLENDDNKQVIISNNEFLGSYYKRTDREQFYECYLIKDSLLDDSINLDGANEYTYEENYYYKHKEFPFYQFGNVTIGSILGNYKLVSTIPADVVASNFTITEVEEN